MLQLVFHPSVKDDVKAPYIWYQQQMKGLGGDFILELEASYQAIQELPDAWPMFENSFRRYVLSRFPYSIIYRSSQSKIFIVAVMHNRRQPGYWHTRI